MFVVPPLPDPLAHPAKTCEVLQKVTGAIIPLAEIICMVLARGRCAKNKGGKIIVKGTELMGSHSQQKNETFRAERYCKRDEQKNKKGNVIAKRNLSKVLCR